MANSDNAFGLRPVASGGSGPYTGKIERFYVQSSDATAIYVGGLVKPDGSASADGLMSVTGNISTGDAVLGVVVAVEPVTADSLTYRAASTERWVYVNTDPNQVFEVQDDSVGGALAAANVGNSADLTGFTGGDTVYGNSTMEIDSSTATASGDGSEDVVIIGLVQREDNSIAANANWLVRLNNHFMVDGQAGA